MLDIKKQALMEAVNQITIDPEFRIPNGFMIPLRNQLYVKRENKSFGQNMTDTGIIIPETSNNTVIPDVGTVYAVGDEVSDFLLPGLKVCFQGGDIQYMEVMIGGNTYLRMYEHEILGILPPKSFVYQGVRSEAYLRRVKGMKQWIDFTQKKNNKDANELDKTEELEKKKKK